MYGRALALGIGLIMASAVQAQDVEVILQPQTDGPYAVDQVVLVDVLLSRVASGNALPVRMLQLDTSATPSELGLRLPTTHTMGTGVVGDDLAFWWFIREPATDVCATFDDDDCGQNYFIEDDLGGTRPNVVSIAYLGVLENAALEMFIPADSGSSAKLGVIEVTMPGAGNEGIYTLDLVNAGEGNSDAGGAELHASHTLPLTPFRASDGSLSGGTIEIEVGEETLATLDFPALDATEYSCGTSLSREGNNILRLPFDVDLNTVPVAGEIQVRPLVDGGTFGADISGSLVITVEDGNILTLTETGQVLTNGVWYGITNTGGWSGVADFQVDYAVVYGDANETLFSSATDLSAIRANFLDLGLTPDNSRYDINTIGGITATDLSAARADFSDLLLTPSGHGCSP